MGIPKFLQNKDCVTRFMFSDPDQVVDVKGTIVTSEPVENRQDLAAVGIKFDENQVPLSYKIRINEYLSTTRKKMLDVAAANTIKKVDPIEATRKVRKDPDAEQTDEESKPAEEQQAAQSADTAKAAAASNATAENAQPQTAGNTAETVATAENAASESTASPFQTEQSAQNS